MSTSSIIIVAVMLLIVAVSFWVLFKGKRTANVVVVPSYDDSVKKIRDEKYENEGIRISQEQLLEKTDYVINAFD